MEAVYFVERFCFSSPLWNA